MKVLPEQDALKSAAITIASRIIDNDQSDNRIFHMMKQLDAFGDHIISKIEKDDPTSKVACSSGCSYCCHMQVKVTPPEALDILNYVSINSNPFEYERLQDRILNNLCLTEGKALEERIFFKQQTPCIFLTDHTCDIYHVRPLICRSWHSLNRISCETAYQSENAGAEIETASLRNYVFSMIREAIKDICASMHWEYGTYELPVAMNRCMHFKQPMQNWLIGHHLFDIT